MVQFKKPRKKTRDDSLAGTSHDFLKVGSAAT
jgi:hypothetical protein